MPALLTVTADPAELASLGLRLDAGARPSDEPVPGAGEVRRHRRLGRLSRRAGHLPHLARHRAPRRRRFGGVRRARRRRARPPWPRRHRRLRRLPRRSCPTSTAPGVRFRRRGGRLTVYLHGLAFVTFGRGRRSDAVVEVVNGIPFGAGLARRGVTVPLVHHLHREQWRMIYPGWRGRLGWWIERTTIRAYRRLPFLTVSQATAADLADLGVPAASVRVVPNGAERRPRQEPAGDGPVLCTLSRLVPHKQLEHAVDAVVGPRPTTSRPAAAGDRLGMVGARAAAVRRRPRCRRPRRALRAGRRRRARRHPRVVGGDAAALGARGLGAGGDRGGPAGHADGGLPLGGRGDRVDPRRRHGTAGGDAGRAGAGGRDAAGRCRRCGRGCQGPAGTGRCRSTGSRPPTTSSGSCEKRPAISSPGRRRSGSARPTGWCSEPWSGSTPARRRRRRPAARRRAAPRSTRISNFPPEVGDETLAPRRPRTDAREASATPRA